LAGTHLNSILRVGWSLGLDIESGENLDLVESGQMSPELRDQFVPFPSHECCPKLGAQP